MSTTSDEKRLLTIPSLAQDLHSAALSTPHLRPSGTDYLLFEGPLYAVHPSPALQDPEKRRLTYSYLKMSGNAVCIHRKHPTQWRLSLAWKEPTTRALENFVALNTVTTTTPKEKDTTMATITTIITESDQLLDFFRRDSSAQPLSTSEISAVLSMSLSSARRLALQMTRNNTLFRRLEDRSEQKLRLNGASSPRLGYLYYSTSPVPERTEALNYAPAPVPVSQKRKSPVVTASHVLGALTDTPQSSAEIALSLHTSTESVRKILSRLAAQGDASRMFRAPATPTSPQYYYSLPLATTATSEPQPLAAVVTSSDATQILETYVSQRIAEATGPLQSEYDALLLRYAAQQENYDALTSKFSTLKELLTF